MQDNVKNANVKSEAEEVAFANYFPPIKELISRLDLNLIGISFSNSHLIKLEAEGKFPKRIPLSEQKVAWVKQEIFDWLSEKKANRT